MILNVINAYSQNLEIGDHMTLFNKEYFKISFMNTESFQKPDLKKEAKLNYKTTNSYEVLINSENTINFDGSDASSSFVKKI